MKPQTVKVFAIGFVSGWLGLLAVKYCIVGVKQWNSTLHPNRTESYDTYSLFGSPLLGALKR
jgi:hypothetical protein